MSVQLRFTYHRLNAKKRGIEFRLTFAEWLDIWTSSGNLHLSGRGANRYCMARNGDSGAYQVGNVRIITNRQNRQEQRFDEATRQRMTAAILTPHSVRVKAEAMKRPETRAKISALAQKCPRGAHGYWVAQC